jgi:hypothetical protein
MKIKMADKGILKEKGFKYWWINVFIPHYKGQVIAITLIAGLIVYFVFSMVSGSSNSPDFMFSIVTRLPAYNEQGEGLEEFFWEQGYRTQSTVISLNEDMAAMIGNPAMSYELLMVNMINEDIAMFIIGESMLDYFEEQLDGFYLLEQLGLPAVAHNPYLTDLSNVSIMEDLWLNQEPMYGLIRIPRQQRNGLIKPEDTARIEKAVDSLRTLLHK